MKKYLNLKLYFYFALHQILGLLSPLIRKWEISFLKQYGNQPLKHQPVFIIGAPRTGSTILYQILTNLYDVLYVDNLVCMFHRNFFFGFWLSNKLYGPKAHNRFEADYGRTIGWHSPSECGQFWYRWLRKDRHFIDHDEITPRMVEEIRSTITAVSNYFDKPLVIKNLNAGQRIRLLTKCFPKANFIFITRDPIYTAQAILLAKRQIGIKENVFWSVMPPNVLDLKNISWDEQITKQVYYLERQIVSDSSFIASGSFFTIRYKNLSLQYIETLAMKLSFVKRINAKEPIIYVNEVRIVDEEAFQILQENIETLDWSFISE